MNRQKLWSLLIVFIMLCGLVTPAKVSAIEVARFDPTIALVLGGGSARGFSHVGLIRALEENGIPVDLLVGTSMGSIVAGLYAAGYSVENMTEIVTALDMSTLLDIPMPLGGGVVDTTGIQHFLDVLFEGRTYNQLPIPYYSIIVNLRTGRELALHDGKVSKGIQASMSIPGIFPPVQIGDQYYVDGGLKNQVPANVAADLGADIILAVSLEKDFQDPNHRRIMTNIQMSLTAMMEGYTEINTAMADVLIVPEVAFDSSMDYQRADYFIQQGYKAGLTYMDEIKTAILAKYPDFEFTPYHQPGYTSQELKQILRTANREVANLPRRFTLKPELKFDSDYSFPKLGLKFTHGPLNWFGMGYRYGFHPQEGGHEVFIDWGRDNWGSVDLYVRQSPEREDPTFGLYVGGPKIEQLMLEGTYVSQGPKAWQVSASNTALLNYPRAVAGLALRVTGLRPEEMDEETNIQDHLLMAVAPQVQVFPWGEEYFPVGMVLSRPYLLTGVTVETPVTELELRPTFRVGIGSELQFFGLYPGDVSLGVEVQSTGKSTWKFGLKSIKF